MPDTINLFFNSNLMKHNIEDLQHLKKIDAPPYLYGQILQRINTLEQQARFTPLTTWALSAAIVGVWILTIWVLIQQNSPDTHNNNNNNSYLTELSGGSLSNNIYENE